jgi:hypothetical protein
MTPPEELKSCRHEANEYLCVSCFEFMATRLWELEAQNQQLRAENEGLKKLNRQLIDKTHGACKEIILALEIGAENYRQKYEAMKAKQGK